MQELPTGEVTFLLTDVEGSTRLWETEPSAMRAALGEHDRLLTEAVEVPGGAVIKSKGEGDSLFAVFPTAAGAVAAALEAQRSLSSYDWGVTPIRVRMAIHTGTAQLRDGDYYGPTVNRSARVRAIGHGGQILLSSAAASLSRASLPADSSLVSMGQHRLKDLNEPEEIFQLSSPDLPADFPPLRSLDVRLHNLPVQLTAFVGREDEMVDLEAQLATHRMVTLTGTGGAGKTRLALQLGTVLIEDFGDGVWVAELAATSNPESVPSVVAQALGLRDQPGVSPEQAIVTELEGKRLLLILDNCEHLVTSIARLAAMLLRAAPGLSIVATSREPLSIGGELIWRVPSLTLPEASAQITAGQVGQAAAATLFVERAQEAEPSFELSERNALAIARICRRLDGIPLALELAAARLRAFSVAELADRLDRGFELLTTGDRSALPRQRTLRATIDWSYDLLDPDEQALFRRLAVFVGGWTTASATVVCGDDELPDHAAPDLLARLVERSMVDVYSAADADAKRFRFLAVVREYALERLRESPDEAETRGRHFTWCVRLAEAARDASDSAAYEELRTRLIAEAPNIRAAAHWASGEHQTERVGGTIGSQLRDRLTVTLQLGRALVGSGHMREAARWFRDAVGIADASGEESSLAEAAREYLAAAQAASGGPLDPKDAQEIVDLVENKLAQVDSADRVRLLAMITETLHYLPYDHPSRQRAGEVGQSALDMALRTGDPLALFNALSAQATLLWRPELSSERLEILVRRSELASELGHPSRLAMAHLRLMEEYVSNAEREASLLEFQRAQSALARTLEVLPRASVSLMEAMLHVLMGDLLEAAESLDATSDLIAHADAWSVTAGSATCLLSLRMLQGEAHEYRGELIGAFETHGSAGTGGTDRALLALLWAYLGDSRAARSNLDALAQTGYESIDPDHDRLGALAAAAESCWLLGASELAPLLRETILPWNGAIPFGTTAVHGSTFRHLGFLELLLGRHEEAAQNFTAAIEMNEQMGARPYTALCQLDLARLILSTGDQPERAPTLLAEAERTFVEIGMDQYAGFASDLRA